MEFEWTPAQLDHIKIFEQFAESYFSGRAAPSGFDREAWMACSEQGLLRLPLPVDTWGGMDAGLLTTVAAFDALGRKGADPGLMFALGAHLFGCTLPVAKFAKPKMQADWGQRLATGQAIAALSITEPAGGSNLRNMKTIATKKGDNYIINGEKTLISNAPVADLFLVLAVTDPKGGIFGLTAFLVPKDIKGLAVTPLENTAGLKGAPMGRVHLDNCAVTENEILGSVNSGFHVFTRAMQWERSALLSGFLGAAQRDLDDCVRFINERQGDNGALATHQAISHRIAKMQLRLETARLLLFRAVWAVEKGKKDAYTLASMAKYQASETLVANAIDSMRIQAGSGWSYQPTLAAMLQNSVGTLFASGTSEIQLNIIATASGLKRR